MSMDEYRFADLQREMSAEDEAQEAYLRENPQPAAWEWPCIIVAAVLVVVGAYLALMRIAEWLAS